MSRNKPKSRVRTAKGRKTSSTRWLQRQLNDPYINKAQKAGYRSRAAFKLKEIDEKLSILKPQMSVIDLGAAPGGWSQVAVEKGCEVIALDLLAIDEIKGVQTLQMDFMDNDAPEKIMSHLKRAPDVVLSDMAPNTTGHKKTDHLKIMAVVEAAYLFATDILKNDGTFVAKVLQGGAQNKLLSEIKKKFKVVRHIKPPSSRKESSEQYLVATGFRAQKETAPKGG